MRSPHGARAYLDEDDDAATAEAFRDGWFHSGDITTIWPDGFLTLGGRLTDFMNHGGVKVAPELIEDALLRLPGVTDAASFSVPDALVLDELWIAIVAPPSPAQADIIQACRASQAALAKIRAEREAIATQPERQAPARCLARLRGETVGKSPRLGATISDCCPPWVPCVRSTQIEGAVPGWRRTRSP